jgi:hypothetical protein
MVTCLGLLLTTVTPAHAHDDCVVAATVTSITRQRDEGVSLPVSIVYTEMLFRLEGLPVPDDEIPDVVSFIFHSRITLTDLQALQRQACAQDDEDPNDR